MPTSKLNSNWVTGFSDGESCFTVSIRNRKESKIGWIVGLVFAITLSERDIILLYRIQSFFGVGTISINKNSGAATYSVRSIKDLTNVIIPHFDKYPLITKKRADFLLFKQVVDLMNRKEHLDIEGLKKVLSIKAAMNLGLTKELAEAFPNIKPIERPSVELLEMPDSYWLAGFIDASACFYVDIYASSETRTGFAVCLRLIIGQHNRDLDLLKVFMQIFGCGIIRVRSLKQNSSVEFRVSKFSDIINKIIPLLDKYPLQGIKLSDYQDFCLVATLMAAKAHLTGSGLEEIRKI